MSNDQIILSAAVEREVVAMGIPQFKAWFKANDLSNVFYRFLVMLWCRGVRMFESVLYRHNLEKKSEDNLR